MSLDPKETQTVAQITITLNLPDNLPADITPAEILKKLVRRWGWTAQVPDPDNPGQTVQNPVTAKKYFDRYIWNFMRQELQAELVDKVADAARRTEQDRLKQNLDAVDAA
jgi:hypothetical protein